MAYNQACGPFSWLMIDVGVSHLLGKYHLWANIDGLYKKSNWADQD